MKIRIITNLSFLFLATGCQSTSMMFDSPSLVGTWRMSGFADDSYYSAGYYFNEATYTPDGIKCSLGIGMSERFGLEIDAFISSWEVSGDELHITPQKSSHPSVKIGESLISEILVLNKKELKYLLVATDSGETFENVPMEHYRKLSDTPSPKICLAVEKFLQYKHRYLRI